ncbi:hypothetical protein QA641_35470 [Bradyrhizobium sp. CB1650]|uniref:hypothetical protein n=1 Tax=Bradyrhizobium sp. CB1650 TaxID=3039153 RepID=UPI002435894E|nr:hypothetical protein [Bradyrhizobium sp. CB1650]WGD50838.1 hypothetical protein QA641_35470 [Bradyrhizobium sp. CB1650]
MALVAGIVPAVYAALKLDEHLPTAMRLAGEYKNLSFSGTSPQRPYKPFDVFEAEHKEARARLENANKEAYTPPGWCFKRARAKSEPGTNVRGRSAEIRKGVLTVWAARSIDFTSDKLTDNNPPQTDQRF